MGLQKKHGKGRLDKWYKLAKEKGYRARAAFKLIQINKKYQFLENSKVVLDLCAAPGSWCQVAAETMPPKSLIIGVDLSPIKPIAGTITFQSDIRTDKCRATIRQHLKTWKVDTVLHDGAPNVGTAWVQDAFTQAELTLQAMKLATEFLREGGTFVSKIFRSKDYNNLLWVFNQLFSKVEATKPPSSRNVSAEIFVVCRGYKAPRHIDPKFLDSRSVFAELSGPTTNNEAKVFKPEVKKRKREGYEEGDYTQFKEAPISKFVQDGDPIAILATFNRLNFAASDDDILMKTLDKLPETTEDVRLSCEDLKVLGRKEFRNLLRWRLKVRERFGLSTKKSSDQSQNDHTEVTSITEMDEELAISENLQKMKDQETSRRKRQRRRENERKQREITRMQLHMTAPTDIGLEQAEIGGDKVLFDMRAAKRHETMKRNPSTNGVIEDHQPYSVEDEVDDFEASATDSSLELSDNEDNLDEELEVMYSAYQERKARSDADQRARRELSEKNESNWSGISESEDENEGLSDNTTEISSDDEDSLQSQKLANDFAPSAYPLELSGRASKFFEQPIFNLASMPPSSEANNPNSLSNRHTTSRPLNSRFPAESQEGSNINNSEHSHSYQRMASKSNIQEPEELRQETNGADTWSLASWENRTDDNCEVKPTKSMKESERDIEIITSEAMALAQSIASGQKLVPDLIDEGFNKYAFRDSDGLPEWFLADEGRHSKPNRPITAAAAAAIKEKLRALNARPIKKVREAKGRKKFKAAQRLEKLRRKSALLADDGALSEKDKASSIAKLMSKAAKKQPKRQIKLVVARGQHRGIAGRPRGVKGRYKIVDARLKKDTRAEKRIAKKKK